MYDPRTRCNRPFVVVLAMLATLMGWASVSRTSGAAEWPKSGTFVAKGVKLHFVEAGRGEPVILVHGLYSSAFMNWQLTGVMSKLAESRRVIAIDLPGHGSSDKPTNDEAYGVQMVDDVMLLMDHLKLKKADVVGYSLGGMVVMKLLARHPERVKTAVVGGMGWMNEGGSMQKFWDGLPRSNGRSAPSACMNNMGKLALSETELRSIKQPVLVLVGGDDVVKMLYVTPLRKIRADWRVVEIPQAGHFTCIIKSQFKDEIVRWLK